MATLRESTVGLFGRRLAQALPVMLLATLLAFGLLKLVPGDIAVTLAGDNASDQPSQTAHLALSAARIHGSGLEFKHKKGGVSFVGSPGA